MLFFGSSPKLSNLIIDSFYSLLVKIKEELSMNKEEKINRGQFIIKFDIDKYINLDSESFDYKEKLIKFKWILLIWNINENIT